VQKPQVLAMETCGSKHSVVMMPKKPLPVSARLPADIKAAAEKAATDDHRSLSSLIEKILADWLRERRYLPAPGSSGRTAVHRDKTPRAAPERPFKPVFLDPRCKAAAAGMLAYIVRT
jgi:hypothetical protein